LCEPIVIAVKVVDASALAALLFGEPAAAIITARLLDSKLVAPALLGYEIANVCLKKIRARPDQRSVLLAALAICEQMGIEMVGVDHVSVLPMAEQYGLTTYDASYLWLTRQLNGELVTLDRQLTRAAGGRTSG
jgi:predicted nucleic acid-binding protein